MVAVDYNRLLVPRFDQYLQLLFRGLRRKRHYHIMINSISVFINTSKIVVLFFSHTSHFLLYFLGCKLHRN